MKTLYIGALPYKTDAEGLQKLLAPFELVGPVNVHADWENPTHEPYALAQVVKADQAVEALDGYKIGSAHLRVHVKPGGQNG